ncbi:hypothetical protein ACFXB5_28295, partial [Streptomyces sp. NPDC059455]
MRRVPWLRPADKDRIAWAVNEVSDAGWTANEVLAALDLRQEPLGGVRRASGFLAARLRGMATMPGWTSRQQRAVQVDHGNAAVDAARKNRIQQVRNSQERSEGAWQAPRSAAVRSEIDQLLGRAFAPKLVLFLPGSNAVSYWVAHLGVRRRWGRPAGVKLNRQKRTVERPRPGGF